MENNIEKDIKIIKDNLFNIQKDTCLQLRVSIENLLNELKKNKKDIEAWKKYVAQLEDEIVEKNNKICELEFKIENCNKIIDQLNNYIDMED